MQQFDQTLSVEDEVTLDLDSEDGAAVSVEIVGYAAVFAAVLAIVIAAGPEIGELVASGVRAAISAVLPG